MAKCAGITRAGTACKGIPIDGSQWCYVHHPDHAEERRRHGARGGKRGGRGRPQVELAEIKARLSALAADVLEGKADRGNAAVASQVLNVYLRAVSVELKVVEQRELLERIEVLESQQGGKTRWG
ncbi:MAG: hypothetical protein M3R38_25865 [Actinomycetota bacterium]|nr:hypothetical protein [Actinomycetota bacterium]